MSAHTERSYTLAFLVAMALLLLTAIAASIAGLVSS